MSDLVDAELRRKIGVTMSHEEIMDSLGVVARQKIAQAGYCLVPRRWRDGIFDMIRAGMMGKPN